MKNIIIICLLISTPTVFTFAQRPTITNASEKYVLRDLLGARFRHNANAWIMPDTCMAVQNIASNSDEGVPVAVDTIFFRKVGTAQEAWVLFHFSNYVFNFARLQKAGPHWELVALRYNLHEGGPGEYAYDTYNFQKVGDKTFISIKESWYGMGVITEKWVLYDPFSYALVGDMDWSRTGEQEQNPDQYTEYTTEKTTYSPLKGSLPDIVLTQQVIQKLSGRPATQVARKLWYRYNRTTKQYEKKK